MTPPRKSIPSKSIPSHYRVVVSNLDTSLGFAACACGVRGDVATVVAHITDSYGTPR